MAFPAASSSNASSLPRSPGRRAAPSGIAGSSRTHKAGTNRAAGHHLVSERATRPLRVGACLPLPRPLHGRQAAAAPDPRPRPRPGRTRAALPARPRRRSPREWEGEHPLETIRQIGVPHVFLAGWRPHEQLPQALNSGDLLVLPSVAEAFGLALIEAMACGLPVIACAAHGPAEIVRDGQSGWLVPPTTNRHWRRRYLRPPPTHTSGSGAGTKQPPTLAAATTGRRSPAISPASTSRSSPGQGSRAKAPSLRTPQAAGDPAARPEDAVLRGRPILTFTSLIAKIRTWLGIGKKLQPFPRDKRRRMFDLSRTQVPARPATHQRAVRARRGASGERSSRVGLVSCSTDWRTPSAARRPRSDEFIDRVEFGSDRSGSARTWPTRSRIGRCRAGSLGERCPRIGSSTSILMSSRPGTTARRRSRRESSYAVSRSRRGRGSCSRRRTCTRRGTRTRGARRGSACTTTRS